MPEPTAIGTPPWTREQMLADLDAFAALYARRPVRDNQGGMRAPHMFAAWFMARRLRPALIVESGVWKGQGTWLLEQACPDAELVCIDIDLSRRQYVSPRARYSTQDFSLHAWEGDMGRALAFFDDHQDAPARLEQSLRAGIRDLIFEDNYPPGQGDCVSLKQTFARRGALASVLQKHIEIYQEFPPVIQTATTRWNTPWTPDTHPTPPPLLDRPREAAHAVFQDEAQAYTWICYVRLKDPS